MAASAIPPAPVTSETVGFVGLGMMGGRVALRLRSLGVPLVVHNRDRAKAAPLEAAGATLAAQPADVGRAVGAGVTFLMLRDGRAVARVLFGRGGLVRGLAAGALVIDLSTIDPAESREFARRAATKGIAYVDAPVGGSIGPAERGELTVFCGGDEAAVARARPWLDRIGRRVEVMGATGAGTSMKLVNNLLTVASVAMISEALALAEALELPRERVIALLRAGGGGSVMLEGKHENLAGRVYPPAFLLPLARKDLRLIERAARRAGSSVALTREARRMYDEALAMGHEREDFSSVYEAARARTARAARAPLAPDTPVSSGPAPVD